MESISAATKSRRSKSLNKNLSGASATECEASRGHHFNTKSIKVTQKEKTNDITHQVESSYFAASALSFLSLFKRSMRHKKTIQADDDDDANGLDVPPSAFLLRRKSSSTSNLVNCKSTADSSFGSSVQPHVSEAYSGDDAICAHNTTLI